ncbi:MAG: hypothetical protein RL134_515 [Actinomycetota bacterium]|jgi:hypothetical protein
MRVRSALIATATAVAVVAAPAFAASPAQAAPAGTTGTTLISFKKEYAGIIKLIAPIKPAKYIGSKLTFPVQEAGGDVIVHSGGIKVGDIRAMAPNITINVPKKRAKVYFEVNGKSTLLFTAKHFKEKAAGSDAVVWQGDLHLTKNKKVVDLLNSALGVDSLTPGLGLGQIRSTIRN